MKIYLLILACLLLSCANNNEITPTEILSESEFGAILKDIHLEDALIELNQKNQINSLKNNPYNMHLEIYSRHNISEEKFKLSLDYYCDNPEKLEKIYTKILNELSKEISNYDLQ